MSWSSEGPIIGMKKREREASAQRSVLESRVRSVIDTLEQQKDSDDLGPVVDWAAVQLDRALRGLEPEPYVAESG